MNCDETLNGSFTDDYTTFLAKVELATPGNIPEQTAAALRLKSRKQRLWKRYIKSKDLYEYAIFTKAKNDLRKLTRQVRTEFETQLLEEGKHKPRQFWKYDHSKLKKLARIPTIDNPDGTFAVTNKEMAESLNSSFSNICVDRDLANMPESHRKGTEMGEKVNSEYK